MLVARSELDQRGPARVQPHPEGTSPRGAPQMLDDRRPHLVQRRADRRRGPPAVAGRGAARRTGAGCGRGSRPRRRRRPATAAVTSANSARARGSASAAAATLPISSRAVTSGSRSASVGASRAVKPRAAASAATTRSVTISWVSQRRSCRPSLVPLAGSAAAARPVAQPRFGRVDLVDRNWGAGNGRHQVARSCHRHLHRR